jgi:general secretion pathway protein D
MEVQFLSLDSDRSYHYGASLPTTFQLLNFGAASALKSILPTIANATTFLTFGGGATLFGLGLADATIFATYANSFTRVLYDATVVVADGQSANFHIGDKYPIPQTLYTGFQQTSGSIYNPIGQITLEDLGLILKLTPRVDGEGEIKLDVEANYKSLGAQTFNTVPAINEREFKGSVILREGEWAVIGGMDADTHNVAVKGLAGLSQIAVLNQLLSENTRDTQSSKTLVVIKPVITRLPMSDAISPQYFLGPLRGDRVLF